MIGYSGKHTVTGFNSRPTDGAMGLTELGEASATGPLLGGNEHRAPSGTSMKHQAVSKRLNWEESDWPAVYATDLMLVGSRLLYFFFPRSFSP